MLTERDLALRRRGITASEIGILLGVTPGATLIDLYEAKVGGAAPDEASIPMLLGTDLEAPICRIYAERTGLHLRESGTLQHPVHAFALATPDRLAWLAPVSGGRIEHVEETEGAVLNVQAKSTEWPASLEWGQSGTDEVPERVRAQVNWEMGVTGLRQTDVPVLVGKRELRIYSVAWDEQLWAAQLEVAERFLVDHVWARVPPPVDASDSYREYLYRASPEAAAEMLDVDEGSDLESLVYWWHQLKAASKAVDEQKSYVDNQLRQAIGAATGFQGRFGKVKWHRHAPKLVTDWEGLAREVDLVARLAVQAMQAAGMPEAESLATRLAEMTKRHQRLGSPYNQLRATWAKGWSTSMVPLTLGGQAVPPATEKKKLSSQSNSQS